MSEVNRSEIERLLTERGLSKSAMAAAMGLRQAAISELLAGKRSLKAAEIPPFANFLGVDVIEALRLMGVDIDEEEDAA